MLKLIFDDISVVWYASRYFASVL